MNMNIIKGATLLSVEEAEQVPQTIREFKGCGWWWLRSPGHFTKRAAYVYYDGRVNELGYIVHSISVCVRPALILNLESKPTDGAKLTAGDYSFTIVCDGKYALCDTPVGWSAFRENWESPDANDYEVSDIKKVVDDWYQNEIKGKAVTKVAYVEIGVA